MIAAGRFAYGNARVRAMRSRLLGPEDAASLRAATSLAALAGAVGAAPAEEPSALRRELFDRLVVHTARVIASYPRGGGLFRAMLGLHEIENWKLAWRAQARGLEPLRWAALWRPLGKLESLRLDDARAASSLSEVAALARSTPYEATLAEALRHRNDVASAERVLDRFATRRVADEARRLPRRERAARDLALGLVRERDADAIGRAVAARVPLEEARHCAAVFSEEPEGAGGGLLTLRQHRRKACRTAFLGPALRLAPAVAYLLLEEEQVRAVSALAEGCIARVPGETLDRALAASALAG